MSLTNPNKVITEERLSEFYQGILPYLGGMPEAIVNKFSKSDIYSTTEKMVGQWIDGKPLYQKTINFGALPKSTTKTVNHGISNIDKIVNIQAIAVLSTGALLLNDITGSNYVRVTANKTSIDITDNVDRSSANGYVTLHYTKTTDSTTSIGVETDYSTTEKIIGTWVNGKPIYQKTINFGALPNNTTKSVAHGISNFGTLIQLWGNASVNGYQHNIPYMEPFVSISINATNVYALTKTNLSSSSVYITLQYTKTN